MNEFTFMLIIFILMLIFFFIPSITFSDMIIGWNEIPILNYIRAGIYTIGSGFIPGYCLLNIFLPNNDLHKRFEVEPFIIKLVLYPLISYTFLGSFTLIVDQIGLSRGLYQYVLIIAIIILFSINLFIQKRRGGKILSIKKTEMKISKYTIFLLFLIFSILLICLGVRTNTLFLVDNDNYRV
ncbi:MAG: hypothetical protein ACFFBW_13730, partial [Promethearchaeota archaeon]